MILKRKKVNKYLVVIAYVDINDKYNFQTVVLDDEESLEASFDTYRPEDYFFSHIHLIQKLDNELYRFIAS